MAKKKTPLATWSLALGFASFLCFYLTAIPAVVVGLLALREAKGSERIQAFVGMGLGALVMVSGGVLLVVDRHEKAQEKEARIAAKEAEADEERQAREAERAELAGTVDAQMGAVEAELARFGEAVAAGERDAAAAALDTARAVLERYRAHELAPEAVQPRWEALAQAAHHLAALGATADARVALAAEDFIAAEAGMQAALTELEALQAGYPHQGPADALVADIRREQKRYARKLEKQQEAVAQAEALMALCGSRPEPDAWDGGLISVDRYMKDRAHDPSSIDSEACTVPVLTEGCWRTRCKVRGKNMLGVEVLNIHTFLIGRHPQLDGMHAVIAAE